MNKKRVIILIGIILIFGIIFCFSNQPGTVSKSTSKGVITKVISILPNTKNLSEKEKKKLETSLQPVVRKTAHFLIYTCLGITAMIFVSTFSFSWSKKIGLSLIIGILWAILDEFHQYFIPRKKCRNKRCFD